MDLKIIDNQGKPSAVLAASDQLFGREYNEALVHQVLVAYQANARTATRAQKGRAEISKSTRKPWSQKGTGRARAGRASSPLWRGGGRVFPNSPDENFSQKVNRKMYRAGVAAILSQLVREDRLAVVEEFIVDTPKTRGVAQRLKEMGLNSVLLITDNVDENIYLASRNLPNVLVLEAHEADPWSLIRFSKVLLTRNAVSKFEEMLG